MTRLITSRCTRFFYVLLGRGFYCVLWPYDTLPQSQRRDKTMRCDRSLISVQQEYRPPTTSTSTGERHVLCCVVWTCSKNEIFSLYPPHNNLNSIAPEVTYEVEFCFIRYRILSLNPPFHWRCWMNRILWRLRIKLDLLHAVYEMKPVNSTEELKLAVVVGVYGIGSTATISMPYGASRMDTWWHRIMGCISSFGALYTTTTFVTWTRSYLSWGSGWGERYGSRLTDCDKIA